MPYQIAPRSSRKTGGANLRLYRPGQRAVNRFADGAHRHNRGAITRRQNIQRKTTVFLGIAIDVIVRVGTIAVGAQCTRAGAVLKIGHVMVEVPEIVVNASFCNVKGGLTLSIILTTKMLP